MNVKAHAKINLSLDVVTKRSDGFHELQMIMVPLSLHDVIHIDLSQRDEFTCNEAMLKMDESNTVYKAVQLMRKHYGFQETFRIHIEKHIPMQAGLAGGSADAAAVMRAINELLHLHLPMPELSMLSRHVGSDVPFCIYQTPAIVKGVGEIITPISMQLDFMILLVKPSQGVPTGKAFSMIDFATCPHPNINSTLRYLMLNQYDNFCASLGNTLEQSALQIVPEIQDIKQELLQIGFDAALMSGSGSTVFGLTRNIELISYAKEHLSKKAYFVYATHVI